MENQKSTLSRSTIAFGLSLAVAGIVNAILVVAKELSPARILPWMKNVTGHHWTTHCLLVLVIFVVVGLILGRQNNGHGPGITTSTLIAAIIGGTVIGILIIAGFYLIVG